MPFAPSSALPTKGRLASLAAYDASPGASASREVDGGRSGWPPLGGTSPDAGGVPGEGVVSVVAADAMVSADADADGDGGVCAVPGETGTCEEGGRVIT